MKFNVSSSDLLSMSSILSRFAQKDAQDGFGYVEIVIFDGIARFTTSNRQGQTARVDYLVDSDKDGTIVVEANRFLKLAKAFTGIVSFDLKNFTLTIKQGKSKYAVQVVADPMLASIKPLDDMQPVKVDFGDMLSKMSFAIDSSIENCLGTYWFNDGAIAASNQFTLCEWKLDTPTGLVACVAPSSVKDLKGTVEIKYNTNQLDVSYGNFYLSSLLMDYKFPPYETIIPKHENYISVERGALTEILRRISLITETGSVKIGVSGSELFIDASTQSGISGDESIPGTVNKNFEVEVSLNIKYIASALASVGGDTVQLYFGNSMQPIIIKNPEQENFTTLIMPMRL